MKKSEGLFKLFYLKQSLLHRLKKASVAFPLGAAPLQWKCGAKGSWLKVKCEDEKVAWSYPRSVIGMNVSFPFLFWLMCCCSPVGEVLSVPWRARGPLQGAALACSLASTSATGCAAFHQPPQALSPQLGPQKEQICRLCALEERVCSWMLGSLGHTCN